MTLCTVNDEQEVVRLKALTKQNLITYALWVLYSADKQINHLKQTDQLTDQIMDGRILTITNNFLKLVEVLWS